MRGDVGPRAMLSYGNGIDSDDNVTFESVRNLHTSISDLLSLVVHAEVPRDLDRDAFRKQVLKTMEGVGGCDATARRRVQDAKELPAAIWQIFHPSQSDRLRDVLNKRGCGVNKPTSKNFDPIHQESSFADREVLDELKKEHGVEPLVIAQFPGEAIMLPAGSTRQVTPILSCISLCNDFISPESASQSHFMVRQMRYLADQQQPSEDKLQIKNLIYHAVKNAVGVLEKTTNSS